MIDLANILTRLKIMYWLDLSHLQYQMKKYVKMIVNKMKEEKLFASQGGPIILAQVNLVEFLTIFAILKGDVILLI
jgi:hypothetical protein